MHRMHAAAPVILALAVGGCNGTSAAPASGPQAPPKAPPASAALPGTGAASEEPQVSGTVLETIDAGPYTYVRMKTAGGEVWAAVNQASLKVGAEVTVGNAMWMEKFESKTLNRKFDRILFGSLADPGAASAFPPGHPPTSGASGQPPAPAADLADVKVEKAPGKDARTVAEIYASKASLKGVEVVVRGKVVKFNADIMGRNWIHLRDGSGSAEKHDNDLTVTSTEKVAKGDVVTLRGKVSLDKDFTAGYAYPVIIEDAKVVK